MINRRRAPIVVCTLFITCFCRFCLDNCGLLGKQLSEDFRRHRMRRLTDHSSNRPLRPWLDPPTPPKRKLAWNASRIKWIGRSFVFPTVDEVASYLYTPHQIQKALRYHSILLQGDSTVRRLYGTLHSVLSIDVWTGSSSDFLSLPKGFPSDVPSPPFGIPASYYIRRGLDSQRASRIKSSKFALELHSPAAIDYR